MGAVTGSVSGNSEFAGGKKLITVTGTIASSSDTITLTKATHGVTDIDAVLSTTITSGTATTFSNCRTTASGLVLTVVSYEGDMTTATSYGTVEIALLVSF
jgi:hypothetical protein